MSNKKEFFITTGLSFLLFFLLAPFGGFYKIGDYTFGHGDLLIIASISYSLFTYWRLSLSPNKTRTVIAILFPLVIFLIPIHLINFDASFVSLPSGIFHFIGVGGGALSYFSQGKLRVIVLNTLMVAIGFYMYFSGYEKLLHWNSFGTLSGEVEIQAPVFKFEDADGHAYSNADFKNKTLVVDFWTTSCGVCFTKFPKLEKLYSKLKDRKDIVIVAVNIPLKGDTNEKAIEMIRKRGYSFEILFAEQKATNEGFEFNAYPTSFIIKDGKMITYKGEIENIPPLLGI
ncbi:hypothetical protein WSM22_35730 [Cytophagales bacterium WSM2-2]|nr:hypothetical protein WSM22_35730 [Cytophagales bacterium WSM2-2]